MVKICTFLCSILLVSAILADDGAALATKQLQEENSKLIEAIERLNQRIVALEAKLQAGHRVAVSANPNPGKIHGLSVDPDAVNYEGGTWLHHPQTGQVVFAENIFQRRQGAGGSLVIELIRKNGKPVPLPSVTYGDLTVAQPNNDNNNRNRRVPRASIELIEEPSE